MLAINALDGSIYFLSNPIFLILTFRGAKKLEYAGMSKSSRKTSISALLTMPKPWLYGSQ